MVRGELITPKLEGMENARKRMIKEIFLGTLSTEKNPRMFDKVKSAASRKKRRNMYQKERQRYSIKGLLSKNRQRP